MVIACFLSLALSYKKAQFIFVVRRVQLPGGRVPHAACHRLPPGAELLALDSGGRHLVGVVLAGRGGDSGARHPRSHHAAHHLIQGQRHPGRLAPGIHSHREFSFGSENYTNVHYTNVHVEFFTSLLFTREKIHEPQSSHKGRTRARLFVHCRNTSL
jgi:hypothetical protein